MKNNTNTFDCECGQKDLAPTTKNGLIPVHVTPENQRCNHIWKDAPTKKEGWKWK